MLYLELAQLYGKLEGTSKRLEKTEILAEFLKKIKHEKNKEVVYLLQGRIFPDYDDRVIGISTQLAMKALSKATGVSSSDIVKKWKNIGDLGVVAEEFSKNKKQAALFSKKLTIEKVLENLKNLPELVGKGTVEKKVSLISELLTSASPLEARYVMRTLLSDLRIGIGAGVLRDAIVWACFDKDEKKDYESVQEAYDRSTDFALVFDSACRGRKHLEDIELVPGQPVKVMLAQKVSTIQEGFEVVGKPAACFPRGELIFSNPSIDNIENFKEGDTVINREGKFQKISKVFERPYSGQIIRIFPSYLFPFTLTPEHRILIIRRQLCSWKNRKVICRPNCQEQKYGCKRNYKIYKKEWIEARKLEKGDFVIFPKFKEVSVCEKIDLIDFNKDKKIEEKEDKIRTYHGLKGTFKGNWINRFIELSNEFFELMGWYLAEGSSDRSGIQFALGYKEEKEAERIKELIKIVFDISAKISKIKNVIVIKGHSSLLQNFFKENFWNYSTNKKIPNFIIHSEPQKIKEFVKAYIKGDGHKTKNDIYIISSASKNIAYQMILLLTKLGILPCVGKYENKGFGDIIYKVVIFGKQINNIEKDSHKTRTSHQRFFDDENFFYIPIRKVEFLDYSGEVFNLETEDNTYLSSAIVHNCEFKYDGFRLLITKNKNDIKLFTRRLENVTKQFPEVVRYVKECIKGEDFIVDSEAVGFNPVTKKYRPFQEISQRIKRKYDIEKLEKELPVEVNVFDLIYYNGKSLIKEEFEKRRKLLEKVVKEEKWKLRLSEQIITSDEKEAEKFYKKAVSEGEEGVMIKNLKAPYKPGARVGYMVKLKPVENEFDLVIVKAEYGTGKRGGWLTSYTVACEKNGKLLEIGKVSTGLKEKSELGVSFEQLSKLLKPLIIGEKGREVIVKPKIIVTVTYQNIQKSPTYESGYALRFPRFTALRPDKSEIASLSDIEKEYKKQR